METYIEIPMDYGYKGANCSNLIIKQAPDCEDIFSVLNDYGEVMLKDANFKQVICLYYDLLNGRFVWNTYENTGLTPEQIEQRIQKQIRGY